jgi:hypothetical protein
MVANHQKVSGNLLISSVEYSLQSLREMNSSRRLSSRVVQTSTAASAVIFSRHPDI